MKRLAIAGLALWLSAAAWAQSGKITGVVSDAITGEALIQASVLVNGTGVATDFDGKYTLDLPYGAYDITVQYIGYESQTRSVQVDRALVQANFKLSTIVLQEAEVIADVAIERETPVAFSNIKPVQIQEELGSQPIPMILNSTPGVYATQAGSDDNGPSISIRGFKQRNVSVLVDGIPEALRGTRAKIVYVMNLMTRYGGTWGYDATRHVEEIARYAGRVPDAVIVHDGAIPPELAKRYEAEAAHVSLSDSR